MKISLPFQINMLALVLVFAQATQAERIALVIGIGDYADNPLKNPPNDAADMEIQLRAAGFHIFSLPEQQADRSGLLEILDLFQNSLGANDDALVFYAGHGAQYDRQSYLIPRGATIDGDLRSKAVPLERILTALEPVKTGLKLVILDACRNSYNRSFSSSIYRGLARLPDIPSGTQIWYATEPGKVAQDGTDRNSPFTHQLLEVLKTPGLSADTILHRVRDGVHTATNGRQTPYAEGIAKEFVFLDAQPQPSPLQKPEAPDFAAIEQRKQSYPKETQPKNRTQPSVEPPVIAQPLTPNIEPNARLNQAPIFPLAPYYMQNWMNYNPYCCSPVQPNIFNNAFSAPYYNQAIPTFPNFTGRSFGFGSTVYPHYSRHFGR